MVKTFDGLCKHNTYTMKSKERSNIITPTTPILHLYTQQIIYKSKRRTMRLQVLRRKFCSASYRVHKGRQARPVKYPHGVPNALYKTRVGRAHYFSKPYRWKLYTLHSRLTRPPQGFETPRTAHPQDKTAALYRQGTVIPQVAKKTLVYACWMIITFSRNKLRPVV